MSNNNMITITIDGTEVTIDGGKKIYDACIQAGIYLPGLCYDPKLTRFGGCRMCVVDVTSRGRTRTKWACCEPVKEGINVSTNSEEIRKKRKVIMEFLLAAKQVDVQAMDRLVCQHSWQQRPRPQALAQQINGMLKGYIDLLIDHQGQYFVVDWKSNYLGADASAYSADAMREALLHKRYDMQYVLYILALHRLLKSRLPNYNYKQHIGGAVYVFLRGIDHPHTQGLLLDKPEQQLIESLDRMFQGAAKGAD